jgi:ketosteroid isomerase-like protein
MTSQRLAAAVAASIAFALLAPAAAPAAPHAAGAMSAVYRWVDAFNRGDVMGTAAVCTSPSSVIDDFAPHVWQGPTGCADWAHAYAALAKSQSLTDGVVKLGAPWQAAVTGDRAYVVVPATFTYKLHGKPVTESGAVLTVALRRIGSGWRIAAWAWAAH